jgi:hypothetical protein
LVINIFPPYLHSRFNIAFMKKLSGWYVCWVLMLTVFSAQAQAVKTETVIYNGVKYPAYTKLFDLSEEQTMDVVKATFADRGAKGTEKKGFLVYRKVVLPAMNNKELHDVFFKVERDGKKSDNKSKLFAIVTRPGAIPEDKPDKDEKAAQSGVVLAAGGYAIFDATSPHVENQTYLNSVSSQEDEVKKAEKRLKDLQTNKAQMDKELAKLQQEIEKNQKDTEAQLKEVDRVRKELEVMKKAPPGGKGKKD